MDMTIKEKIGQVIGTLLTEQNKKQKDLAKELGVTDNTISYFVNGKRAPSLAQITIIAKFFNVSTDFLLNCDYSGTQVEGIKYIMEFLKDAQRMCRCVDDCDFCKNRSNDTCYITDYLSDDDIYEYIESVFEWTNCHPRKTYAQDFFEKFPKAKPDKEGVPRMCRANCYGGSCQYSAVSGAGPAPCKACWNEEMEAADDE